MRPEKDKSTLIASAPSFEELIKLIARYFCGRPESYTVKGSEVWFKNYAIQGEKKLNSFQVRKVKNRYRFEAIRRRENA